MSQAREVIIPKGMEILYEKYHYCPGIKVGNTLYISGQVAGLFHSKERFE
jgi:enamine deaminase RidA (YjgF/YER057c/UK114 family)